MLLLIPLLLLLLMMIVLLLPMLLLPLTCLPCCILLVQQNVEMVLHLIKAGANVNASGEPSSESLTTQLRPSPCHQAPIELLLGLFSTFLLVRGRNPERTPHLLTRCTF